MADKSDFTQGSIPYNIFRMAIPMTTAVLINALYSIVDRVYLGHISGAGSLALTGVGLAFPIITILTAFQNLFGNGGSPLFAMASGNGDKKLAAQYMANAAFMLVVTGFALTAISYALKEKVLWIIGASEKTFSYANDYLDVYLIGTVFVMISVGMNPYINAQGHARTGMMTVLIGAVLNIVLDPIFIFAFNMGVKGAAIATIISQAVSAGWVLLFLFGKKAPIRLDFSHFKPNWYLIGKIVSLGVTDFCFEVTNSAVAMVCNASLARLGGDVWVASMTVLSSIRTILFTVQHGVTGATKPIMSYNYGAKRPDRVRTAINWLTGIMFVYLIVSWAFLMAFPGFFASLFTNVQEVRDCCKISIRIYFCMQFFMTFQSAGQSTFTALGMAKHALFFSLLRKAILVIPLVLILPKMFGLGVLGVFAAEPVSDVIGGLACYITMKITTRKKLAPTTAA